MLIVKVKDTDNIEKALKKYKNKFNRTKVVRELRERKEYVKPTVANRKMKLKAAYINEKFREEN